MRMKVNWIQWTISNSSVKKLTQIVFALCSPFLYFVIAAKPRFLCLRRRDLKSLRCLDIRKVERSRCGFACVRFPNHPRSSSGYRISPNSIKAYHPTSDRVLCRVSTLLIVQCFYVVAIVHTSLVDTFKGYEKTQSTIYEICLITAWAFLTNNEVCKVSFPQHIHKSKAAYYSLESSRTNWCQNGGPNISTTRQVSITVSLRLG